MAFTIENGMWRAVFAVPCDIVDTHLKMLGDMPLRVLLTLLRYNGGLEASAVSSIIGKPESLVNEALETLLEAGIICGGKSCVPEDTPTLTYVEEKEPAVIQEPEKNGERKVNTISTERRKLTRGEITELSSNDESVGWLLQESQAVLGKTLNFVATETITALYSYYGMKPDIIMMILGYCAGIGKASMPYIEKVAASWYEKEIETHEQAEAEIMRLKQLSSDEGRIKSAFGIYDRNLVSSEKKYIHTWISDYGFDVPMIVLAFERAVEVKGKLSFSYINGILANWHKNGVSTPKDAVSDMRKPRPNFNEAKPRKDTSYDLDEIEKRLNQGIF